MRIRQTLLLLTPLLAHAADAQVTIDNFTFSPAVMTVASGTRVVWMNRDDMPHTVTAAEDPHGTRSPPLDTGDSYARTFSKPGIWHYFCSVHPRMQGTVLVR